MKNKILFLIFMLFCFVNVSASAYRTTADLNFRTKASTSGSIITTIGIGNRVIFVEESTSGNGCEAKWYKVEYNGKTGYVCSSYLKEISAPVLYEPKYECTDSITTSVVEVCNDETCSMVETESVTKSCVIVEEKIEPIIYTEEILRGMGFSDGYIDKLLKLNKDHPYWRFVPDMINYNFSDIVARENTKDGRSLLEDSNRSRDGLKTTASWAYDYKTDKFNTSYYGGGSRWYAASNEIISYYMDPRNFLNERQIFMFEQNSYNPELHTLSGIKSMLKGSFMDGKMADDKHTCAEAFLDAAITNDVSPYLLVSRVIQEVGKNGSTIIWGDYPGYEGYYNFYNINAAGKTNAETITNGLKHAKSKGWNTWYKAIVGGGSFLSSNYISVGQDTLYLEKWDLIGDIGSHQYMQNIEAPANECVRTYSSYLNLGMLDSTFVFKIPVYKNMAEEYEFPDSGNPNNYLKELKVNGEVLFNDASSNTVFEREYYKSITELNIEYSKVSSKASVSGAGIVKLSGDYQEVKVVVKAQNSATRTYTIKVTRKDCVQDEAINLDDITKLEDFNIEDSYLTGITVGTKIEDIKLDSTDSVVSTVNWKDINGKEKTSGVVCSGDKVTLTSGGNTKELMVIIYGDVNSDGEITSSDYVLVKNHIMGTSKLDNIHFMFADANKDSNVTSSDYVIIKNSIMGTGKIEQ